MSTEEHLYYFSSKFTKQNKNTGFFDINLPITLDLSGKWKCGILDLYVKDNNSVFESIYVSTSFCNTSLIHEQDQIPVLKKVNLKSGNNNINFPHPLYIKVKQKQISNFSLSCLDTNLRTINFDDRFLLELTLHFVKYG